LQFSRGANRDESHPRRCGKLKENCFQIVYNSAGFGVGNASASATHALLLTVLQEILSRLTSQYLLKLVLLFYLIFPYDTAIVAAYYVGTCLFPEAKTYRFLADILYDAAIVLDVISPWFSLVYIPFYVPWLFPGSTSGLRIIALCLSASLRALCGIAAGGSKSALSLHFATPDSGKGDLGELNAKDGSKETVLSLLGMLVRSYISYVAWYWMLTEFATFPARKSSCTAFDDSMVHLYSSIPITGRSSHYQFHSRTGRCLTFAEQAESGNCMDNLPRRGLRRT
jgi:hypothetical protein